MYSRRRNANAVLTRWLLIGLLISVGALLFAVGAMVRHVRRQHRTRVDEAGSAETGVEAEIQVKSDAGLPPGGSIAGDAEAKHDASGDSRRSDVMGE